MKTLLLIILTSQIFGQSPIKVWNDMGDFNQHRTVSTAIAWTGTIFACKMTGNCQWKGAVIGGGISLGIGGLKEVVWDGAMHRGVPSSKDFLGDCIGTAVGTMAGVMCNGVAQHIRDKREYERSLKFTNPLEN